AQTEPRFIQNAGEEDPMGACARNPVSLMIALLLTAGLTQSALGFGVFTHEAIIEISWQQTLQPLLLHRFPPATPEQLRVARTYAYGGAIIQDLGYFPRSNEFYSDLLHYVRS